MRSTITASLLVAGALTASGALLAQVRAPASGFIPVSEVRAGMRGYGLTVFRGMRPERFDVEVLDVIHNFRPHMDLVLIRPAHPILERAGTVAGMSGSPIYINDRLLGAYAYGWEFGRDPVAGVTPIEDMLAELRRPRRTPPGLMPGSQVPIPIGPARARADHDPWGALAHRAVADRQPVNTPYGALVPVASPLVVGGITDRALRALTEAMEPFGIIPVQAGGSGNRAIPADAPTHYESGGGLTVRLIQGDVSGNIGGTVTYVNGGNVLAFGHPMMGMGETALPAAIARVMWILASERRSMKLSEPVRSMGSLIQDRPTSVIVDEAAPAPTVPVHVRIRGADGAPHDDWNAQVAGHRALVGRLAGTVITAALDSTSSEQADTAWTIRSRITLRDHAPVEFVERGTSPEGTGAITTLAVTDALNRLSDNPFRVLGIERLDVDVQLSWAREFAYIRSASLAGAEVDPGSRVDLRVVLVRYGLPPEMRLVSLEVPRELAGREVEVEVAGGGDAVPDLAEPESVEDLVRNLSTRFPEDALVVSLRMPGLGVTLRGRLLANLPGSAFDALRPSASSDTGDPLFNIRRMVVPVGRVVLGRDRIRLRVREVRL